MSGKPTYEELEQRLKELEKEALEHNRTEKALGVAEHKLRELYRAVEQSSEGIATASLDGNFVFTNPTWAEMHGYQPDELVGQPVGMLDSPEDREKLPAIWQEIKKNGFWRGELQRVRKNGSSFPATMTSSLVRDDRDTPFVIIGTCRDITERKLAEDELKRAHDELERQVEERTAELKAQSNRLKKANTALKVLLEQSEVHKKELEENFLSNVEELVGPCLETLKKSRLSSAQNELLSAIETNLSKIASPFIKRLSLKQYNFTPREIRVANLIKIGKKNKEIAEILGLSHNTILFHRFNIRTKLGIRNKNVNLRSLLESFDE